MSVVVSVVLFLILQTVLVAPSIAVAIPVRALTEGVRRAAAKEGTMIPAWTMLE